jgi:hypothetical protein
VLPALPEEEGIADSMGGSVNVVQDIPVASAHEADPEPAVLFPRQFDKAGPGERNIEACDPLEGDPNDQFVRRGVDERL